MLITEELIQDETILSNISDILFVCIHIARFAPDFYHLSVLGTAVTKQNLIRYRYYLIENPAKEKEILTDFLNEAAESKKIVILSEDQKNSLCDRCRFFHLSAPYAAEHTKVSQKPFENTENYRKILLNADQNAYAELIASCRDSLNAVIAEYQSKYKSLPKKENLSIEQIEGVSDGGTLRIRFSLSNCSNIEKTDSSYRIFLKNGRGFLELIAENSEKKYFFKDFENYYYLPAEDRAIHKSVGQFVDPKNRRQATEETCYERQRALFFNQPEPVITPGFKDHAADRDSWFTFESFEKADTALIESFVYSYLIFCSKCDI